MAVAIVVGVTLVTAAALFGWAIYFDLQGLIGRTAFAYAVLFAFVPVIPLSAAFVWLDRMRPEPPWLLVSALVWGALPAAYLSLKLNGWLAAHVGDVHAASARSAVFIAPWVEETTKAAVIFAIVLWRRHDFNSVVAGVVYGGLAGVGFAFTENILYYGQLFQHVDEFKGNQHFALDAVERLFLWRGIAAPFIHPMFTMMTGLGIGVAVRYRHVGVRILAPVAGFCTAVLLHMGYNASASFAGGGALTAVYLELFLPMLLALIAVVMLVRRHERRVISARLHDYSRFGWLPPDQVVYITDVKRRREVRKYARQFGKPERDRIRQFQQAGMDLGVLRDQLVRGVAGPGELARERELIATIRAFRGRLMLPTSASPALEEFSRATSSW